MAKPDVTITIQDGALGQVPASVANAQVKFGICSAGVVNQLYTLADIGTAQQQLGQGPLVDATAHTIGVAGGPVYAVPLNPTNAGALGSVTHTGTGTGTVTPSAAPAQSLQIKITTGGTIGTFQFAVSIGGGAYGTPVVTTGSPFPYLIPGTLTSITFAAGTYVLNDVYTINIDGTKTLTGTGPAATNLTQTSSPLDNYSVVVTITAGGALGTATFTVSLDGGNNTGAQIATSGGGLYTIPNTGVVLTFAGTFVTADTYSFTTTTASASNTDLTNAFTATLGSAVQWGFAHVAATPASASAAATTAATIDAQMTIAQLAYRFVFTVMECPTVEIDTTIIAAFSSFVSARLVVCVGDVGALSPVNGRILRRNNAWIFTAHLAAIGAGEDPAFVGSTSPPKNVVSLYPNFGATTWTPDTLDANRFTTMRTFPGKPGYFFTNGNTMASPGSDFNLVQRRRVMDIACTVARNVLLDYLNGSVRVNKTTGYIDERDAQKIEGRVNAILRNALVAPGFATDTSVVLNRTTNLLSTNNEPVSVRVTPLAYLKTISVTMGFSNPALAV